jgi:hypothetical protein
MPRPWPELILGEHRPYLCNGLRKGPNVKVISRPVKVALVMFPDHFPCIAYSSHIGLLRTPGQPFPPAWGLCIHVCSVCSPSVPSLWPSTRFFYLANAYLGLNINLHLHDLSSLCLSIYHLSVILFAVLAVEHRSSYFHTSRQGFYH